jgi:hypothetical protein
MAGARKLYGFWNFAMDGFKVDLTAIIVYGSVRTRKHLKRK